MRLQGASYEEIARAGGGIVSTVKLTREAVTADLSRAVGAPRAAADGAWRHDGGDQVGLRPVAERRAQVLHVARELGERLPLTVRTTLLAAHALPPEYAGRPDDYIAHVAEHIVPEGGAAAPWPMRSTPSARTSPSICCRRAGVRGRETRRPAREAACRAAEQHAWRRGAGAEFDALSADHLEHVDEAGVMAMARAGTVAVMLPGAFYFLRDTNVPPIDLFRKHGVAMAVATDCNPGSSPTTHLPLMMNMACTLFRMTPAEALLGVTRHAARALGLPDARHDRARQGGRFLPVGRRPPGRAGLRRRRLTCGRASTAAATIWRSKAAARAPRGRCGRRRARSRPCRCTGTARAAARAPGPARRSGA